MSVMIANDLPRGGSTPRTCKVCHEKAPTVPGRNYANWRSVPNETIVSVSGWSLSFFPWAPKNESEDFFREGVFLCPKCGKKVAEYIAHLAKPWPLENE